MCDPRAIGVEAQGTAKTVARLIEWKFKAEERMKSLEERLEKLEKIQHLRIENEKILAGVADVLKDG